MIDTHAHIYLEDFDPDRREVIQRAKDAGVRKIILPNIDSNTIQAMHNLEAAYPDFCYASIGLHPTSVKADYKDELSVVHAGLQNRDYTAIGEIGIDLYWDVTYKEEQIKAFRQQIEWSLAYNKPVIIHVRESHRETMEALSPYKNSGLKGVFHSFGGSLEEAREILSFGGFLLGINGIVTFKNSGLSEVLRQIDVKHIVLETDAPYLTPVPFRGKRNESAYLKYTAEFLAGLYSISYDEVVKQTTDNAFGLFNF